MNVRIEMLDDTRDAFVVVHSSTLRRNEARPTRFLLRMFTDLSRL